MKRILVCILLGGVVSVFGAGQPSDISFVSTHDQSEQRYVIVQSSVTINGKSIPPAHGSAAGISFKVGDEVRKGGLTVGFTGYRGSRHMGPELGFGFVLGDFYKEPVLLIKTAWGGKSLFVDFRPPSSGGQVGPCYTKMVEEFSLSFPARASHDRPGKP